MVVYNKTMKKFIPYSEFEKEIGKKVENEISLDEWREALEILTANDPGKTLSELAEEFGIPTSTMRDRLKNGIKRGKVKVGKSVKNGRIRTVYQVIAKEKR